MRRERVTRQIDVLLTTKIGDSKIYVSNDLGFETTLHGNATGSLLRKSFVGTLNETLELTTDTFDFVVYDRFDLETDFMNCWKINSTSNYTNDSNAILDVRVQCRGYCLGTFDFNIDGLNTRVAFFTRYIPQISFVLEGIDTGDCMNVAPGDTCIVSCTYGYEGEAQVFSCSDDPYEASLSRVPFG